MPKRTGDYDGWFIEKLSNPKIAADYINAAVREHPENIKVALGNVAKAYTMKKVAKDAGVARESLYTILSDEGNPTLANLNGVLKAVGLRISVVADSEGDAERGPVPKLPVPVESTLGGIEPNTIEKLKKAAGVSFTVPSVVDFFGAKIQIIRGSDIAANLASRLGNLPLGIMETLTAENPVCPLTEAALLVAGIPQQSYRDQPFSNIGLR